MKGSMLNYNGCRIQVKHKEIPGVIPMQLLGMKKGKPERKNELETKRTKI
jgi:hypothetical protein